MVLSKNSGDVFGMRSIMLPVLRGCLIQAHISHGFGQCSTWHKLDAMSQLPQVVPEFHELVIGFLHNKLRRNH